MGGYISFPGGMMAAALARPFVLHEQNSVAGLANKVLARIADRILVAFPGALKNGEWTGNPVRRDVHVGADEADAESRHDRIHACGEVGAASTAKRPATPQRQRRPPGR